MAVYRVTGPDNSEALVDAPNQASARNHVARGKFKVEVAKPQDIARICKAGGDIEAVSDPSAPLLPGEQITSLGHTGGPDSGDDDAAVKEPKPEVVAEPQKPKGK